MYEWIAIIFFTDPAIQLQPEVFKTVPMFTTEETCARALDEQLELLAERAKVHNRPDLRYFGTCVDRSRAALEDRRQHK